MSATVNLDCQLADYIYKYFRSQLYATRLGHDYAVHAYKLLALAHFRDNSTCDVTLTQEFKLLAERYNVSL